MHAVANGSRTATGFEDDAQWKGPKRFSDVKYKGRGRSARRVDWTEYGAEVGPKDVKRYVKK
jgi:hypothetical protein